MSEKRRIGWVWLVVGVAVLGLIIWLLPRQKEAEKTPTREDLLHEVQESHSIPFLLKTLEHTDPVFQRVAYERLLRLQPTGEADVTRLKELAKAGQGEELPTRAIRVLGTSARAGRNDVIPFYVTLLGEGNREDVRRATIEELGQLGPEAKEAAEALKNLKGASWDLDIAATRAIWKITAEKDWVVRKAVDIAAQVGDENLKKVDALMDEVGTAAIDPLLDATWSLGGERDKARERKAEAFARTYLARLGKKALPTLLAHLGDKNDYFSPKERIIDALGEMGADAEDSIPVLIEILALQPDETRWPLLTEEKPPVRSVEERRARQRANQLRTGREWIALAFAGQAPGASPLVSGVLTALSTPKLLEELAEYLELEREVRAFSRDEQRRAVYRALPKIGAASRGAIAELLLLWIVKPYPRARISEALHTITDEVPYRPARDYYENHLPSRLGPEGNRALPFIERLLKEKRLGIHKGAEERGERALQVLSSFAALGGNCHGLAEQLWLLYDALSEAERPGSTTAIALGKALACAPGFLDKVLNTKDNDKRWNATVRVVTLAPSAAKPAFPILLEALEGDRKDKAATLLIGMKEHALPLTPELLQLWTRPGAPVREIESIFLAMGEPVVPQLLSAYRQGDRSVQHLVIRMLGKLKAQNVSQTIEAALKHEDPEIQLAAVESARQIRVRTPVVLQALSDFLAHPEPGFRISAIRALGDLAPLPAGIMTRLHNQLDEKDVEIQGQAMESLIKSGYDPDEKLIARIAENLLRKDSRFRSSTVNLLIAHFSRKAKLARGLHAALRTQPHSAQLDGVLIRWLTSGGELFATPEIALIAADLILWGPKEVIDTEDRYESAIVHHLLRMRKAREPAQVDAARQALNHIAPDINKACELTEVVKHPPAMAEDRSDPFSNWTESLTRKKARRVDRADALSQLEEMRYDVQQYFLRSFNKWELATFMDELSKLNAPVRETLLKKRLVRSILTMSLKKGDAKTQSLSLEMLTLIARVHRHELKSVVPDMVRLFAHGDDNAKRRAGKLLDEIDPTAKQIPEWIEEAEDRAHSRTFRIDAIKNLASQGRAAEIALWTLENIVSEEQEGTALWSSARKAIHAISGKKNDFGLPYPGPRGIVP